MLGNQGSLLTIARTAQKRGGNPKAKPRAKKTPQPPKSLSIVSKAGRQAYLSRLLNALPEHMPVRMATDGAVRAVRYRQNVSIPLNQVLHVAIAPAQAWRSGGDIFPCAADGTATDEHTFSWNPTVGANHKLFPVMYGTGSSITPWSESTVLGRIDPMDPIAVENFQSVGGYGRGASTGMVSFLGGEIRVDHITTRLDAGGRATHHSSLLDKSTIGWTAGLGISTERDSLSLADFAQVRGVTTEYISSGRMRYPILGSPAITNTYESPQFFGTVQSIYDAVTPKTQAMQVGLAPEYVPGAPGGHCTKGFTEHFAFQPAAGAATAATVDITLMYRVRAFAQPITYGSGADVLPVPGTRGPVKAANAAAADEIGAKQLQLRNHLEKGGTARPGKNQGVLSALGRNLADGALQD